MRAPLLVGHSESERPGCGWRPDLVSPYFQSSGLAEILGQLFWLTVDCPLPERRRPHPNILRLPPGDSAVPPSVPSLRKPAFSLVPDCTQPFPQLATVVHGPYTSKCIHEELHRSRIDSNPAALLRHYK